MVLMPDRFPACCAETLRWEGGYSNDPYDPGGATMKGVIQRVYDGYRRGKGQPTQAVRMISDAEVLDIYRRNYWDAVRGDELPAGVDMALYDYGVNSGPAQAVRSLQRVLRMNNVDGHLGAATLAAIQNRDPVTLVQELMAERRRFLRSLSTFWRFGTGWMRRCDGIERAAVGMAGHAAPPVLAQAQPLLDMDAQSVAQGRASPDAPTAPWSVTTSLGVGGSGGVGYEVAQAFARAGSFDPKALAIALLSSPTFWMAIATLTTAAFAYFWHRRHAVQ